MNSHDPTRHTAAPEFVVIVPPCSPLNGQVVEVWPDSGATTLGCQRIVFRTPSVHQLATAMADLRAQVAGFRSLAYLD